MPGSFTLEMMLNYLFITYIVTSKPKRISVAAGVVHIISLLCYLVELTKCLVRMVSIMG
jgi:hypothetical protein